MVTSEPELRFHVQMRSRRGLRRAWAFNLTAERLAAEITTPWLVNDVIVFGDRDWEPRESELKILEGPELDPADLAHSQGPTAAERTAENVTRRVLAAASPAETATVEAATEATAAELITDLNALPGVSIESEEALGLLAERLRSLGLN